MFNPKPNYRWTVAAVSAVGLFFSSFPIAVASFGMFFESFLMEFHTTRTGISLAFTIHNIVTAMLAGWVGHLTDRHGARRVIVPGLLALSAVLLLAWLIGSQQWQLYLFYGALAVVGGATTSVPYSLVVSRWFNARRGLALGCMMAGLGLGTIVTPLVTQRVIAEYGWRMAFLVAGVAVLAVPLPLVLLFLRDAPTGGSSSRSTEGLAWEEIRASRLFWILVGAFALGAASVHACIIHLPQILKASGAGPGAVAWGVSTLGAAVLAGRVGTGYLLDRYFAPRVGRLLLAGSAIGIGLLAMEGPAPLGAFLVGLGFGAEVDVIAYLMGRYFGLRALGKSFGFAFGAFVLAGGIGPLLLGLAVDRTGSYGSPLAVFAGVALLAAAAVGTAGPYKFATQEEDQHAIASEPGV